MHALFIKGFDFSEFKNQYKLVLGLGWGFIFTLSHFTLTWCLSYSSNIITFSPEFMKSNVGYVFSFKAVFSCATIVFVLNEVQL